MGSGMTSLSQIDKVRQMSRDGWEIVNSKRPIRDQKSGGPVLMRKGDDYRLVSAASESATPTPKEVEEW